MTSSLQGIIIALLISLLVGIIIGYSVRQRRVSQLTSSLKHSQKRSESLEQEHQERLQAATLQLQQDYETQLAEKIERYQDQLEERTAQLEQEYQDRLEVMEQGRQSQGVGAGGTATSITPMPVVSGVSAEVQYAEQQIKRQYEDRLREAARKIQQAYEQHLRQKLKETQAALQQDYESRLAQKIEYYEDQLAGRMAQLQAEYDLRLQTVTGQPMPLTPGGESTITLSGSPEPVADPIALEAQLRAEYDQRLAEKIEHYQDELTRRIDNLEREYEARLQVSQQALAPKGDDPTDAEQLLLADDATADFSQIDPYINLETDTVADSEAFSLEEALADDASASGATVPSLDSDFDADDFNLDELLFEQDQAEAGSLPPDLDDISRLS